MKKNKLAIVLVFVLALVAGYYFYSQDSSTIRKELSDFAIEDTASVTKIFLVDNEKNSVLLERINSGKWSLNTKFEARQDAVNVLMTTIKRISVKAPVPKAGFENIVKQIVSRHVKIEIYQNEEKPSKCYYVSHSNQEHNGTYMLLENSSVPFLMHIEGFRGFLTPRYFTNENSWRTTNVFSYGYGEVSSIKSEDPSNSGNSFLITGYGEGIYSMKSLSNNSEIEKPDTATLLQYVALFQNINFEGFEETKTKQFKDSIISGVPFKILTVTDKSGSTRSVKAFLKPISKGSTDLEGNPIDFDLERFYGLIDEKDFVVLQYYVFDPLLKNADDFRKKKL